MREASRVGGTGVGQHRGAGRDHGKDALEALEEQPVVPRAVGDRHALMSEADRPFSEALEDERVEVALCGEDARGLEAVACEPRAGADAIGSVIVAALPSRSSAASRAKAPRAADSPGVRGASTEPPSTRPVRMSWITASCTTSSRAACPRRRCPSFLTAVHRRRPVSRESTRSAGPAPRCALSIDESRRRQPIDVVRETRRHAVFVSAAASAYPSTRAIRNGSDELGDRGSQVIGAPTAASGKPSISSTAAASEREGAAQARRRPRPPWVTRNEDVSDVVVDGGAEAFGADAVAGGGGRRDVPLRGEDALRSVIASASGSLREAQISEDRVARPPAVRAADDARGATEKHPIAGCRTPPATSPRAVVQDPARA